ncbi:MAG: DUF5618 family protein [Aquirufa sp.]
MRNPKKSQLEAARYLANAKEILATKALPNGSFYDDTKYVKMACGTAYNAVLIAIDTYLHQKNEAIQKGKYQRKNIKDYKTKLSKMEDREMQNLLNNAYDILHLYGYYDGINNKVVIDEGIHIAEKILEKI